MERVRETHRRARDGRKRITGRDWMDRISLERAPLSLPVVEAIEEDAGVGRMQAPIHTSTYAPGRSRARAGVAVR